MKATVGHEVRRVQDELWFDPLVNQTAEWVWVPDVAVRRVAVSIAWKAETSVSGRVRWSVLVVSDAGEMAGAATSEVAPAPGEPTFARVELSPPLPLPAGTRCLVRVTREAVSADDTAVGFVKLLDVELVEDGR